MSITVSASSTCQASRGKKKIEGNLHLHFLRAPATDLGSELAGFSAHRARICILQYFSCKAQSSSLELGHTFL